MVWQGCDGDDCFVGDGDSEIYFWDGATITQITDNSLHDSYPSHLRLERGVAALRGRNSSVLRRSGHEIYFWDGVTTTNITNNSINEYRPDISGSNVVWDSRLANARDLSLGWRHHHPDHEQQRRR